MTEHLNHVAIIPDGNRRWSKLHGVPVLEGHRRGAEAMHNVIDYLIGQQIRYLTLWGFSTDNWKRAIDEVRDLLNLLAIQIETDAPWLNERGVRLRHIGRLWELPQSLQEAVTGAIELTKENAGMTLILAFNYSGRDDILCAVRRLAAKTYKGLDPELIGEALFSRELYTDGIPDVDLVIRTAGEVRLSNFMLWQTAYSEYYFTELLWPDFNEKELERALEEYNERQRRFGGD